MLCHFRVGSGGASSRGIITSSSRTTVTRATSVPLVWGIVHIFHIDICYRYVWLCCFYVGWVLYLLVERIKCVFYLWAKFLCFCFAFFHVVCRFELVEDFLLFEWSPESAYGRWAVCVWRRTRRARRERGREGGKKWTKKGSKRHSYTSFNNPLNIRPHYFNEHIISPSVCTIYPHPIN